MHRRWNPLCLVTALLSTSQPSLRRLSSSVWLSTTHYKPDLSFNKLSPPLFPSSRFSRTWLPSNAKQLNLAMVPIVQHTHTCGQSTCASTRSSPNPSQGALPPWSVASATGHVALVRSETHPSRPHAPWQQRPPTIPCTHLPMPCPLLDGSRSLVQPAVTMGPTA